MIDRKKVLTGLLACGCMAGVPDTCGRMGCPYREYGVACVHYLARDALDLLQDTTNPRGGSCSTCIHEYEPGSDYCLTHQKCKVCGICSGYEGGKDDD